MVSHNMAFHCIKSWLDWILFCQQWWVELCRNVGPCPETGFLNWFGTVKVMKHQRQVIACLRTREVSETSQGCHTWNWTAQHPVVKRPAVGASDGFQSGSGQQWTRPSGPQRGVVHTFTGGPKGKRNTEAPHLNDSSSPLSIFLLYFAEIITLLVVETNRYYHDHLERLDEGHLLQPDVTEAEMLVFLAVTIKMGHCIWEKLTDYWSRSYNFHTPFYGNAMKRDRFFHILRFLHFTDNRNEPDKRDENSDRLWKMRNLFLILNEKFSKFYSPSEHLTVDEVIVKFKGRVIFQQYIPKKHKHFGINIYKLCDETGYTYDMTVYLGTDRQCTV